MYNMSGETNSCLSFNLGDLNSSDDFNSLTVIASLYYFRVALHLSNGFFILTSHTPKNVLLMPFPLEAILLQWTCLFPLEHYLQHAPDLLMLYLSSMCLYTSKLTKNIALQRLSIEICQHFICWAMYHIDIMYI